MNIQHALPEHFHQAAPLIRLSGTSAFDHIFSSNHGPDNVTFLQRCFASPNTIFSHKLHYVLIEEENVFGTLSLTTKYDHDKQFRHTAWNLFKHYGLKGILKGLKFEHKLVKPPKKDVLYIAHVTVDEAVRGRGLGGRLIQFAIKTAQDRDIKTLALDVRADNHNAIRLYELNGFKGVKLNKTYHESLSDHIYMEKAL